MMMSNNMENVAPHVIKVVARQVQTLAQEKLEGINLLSNEWTRGSSDDDVMS